MKHISFSQLKTYLSDKQAYKRRYILGEKMEKIPQGMIEGSAVHMMLESWLQGKDVPLPKDALAYSLRDATEVEYKKNNTLDDAIKNVEETFCHALEYVKGIEGDKEAESAFYVKPDAFQVPIKGFIDLCVHKEDKTTIYDYKIVGQYSSGSLAYRLQAMTYAMVMDVMGYNVDEVKFVEFRKGIKKGETFKEHTFNVATDFSEREVQALKFLYILAIDEIMTGCQHYLPNPFAFFSDDEWAYWVDNFDK